MKNNFLKMAMEEAGLEVETPVEATPIATEEEVAALDEVVDAGEDEGAELVKGVEAVTEVQEGLEALVIWNSDWTVNYL